MTAPAKRHELVDVRELRHALPFETRADGDTIVLRGYASTFEPYEMYGGPANHGWIEQIDPTAFDKTLKLRPDLHLLINHEGMPLARTKSGTLTLSVDRRGLLVEARLDRSDPDVQRLEPKMRRGDMNEMSFAFRVKAQVWGIATGFDDPESHRLITEVSLHKGDVSVVNWGANPTTYAEVLGRRRGKTKGGKRMTLTRAEALALVRADQKWIEDHPGSSRRRGGTGGAAAAAADEAAWAAQQAASDAIVARARQILAEYGSPEQPVESTVRPWPKRFLEPGYSVAALPTVLERLEAKEQQRAREAQAAELIRQAEEILHPPRPKRTNDFMQWAWDRAAGR